MKSLTTAQFWKLYNDLPEVIKKRADRSYQLWQLDASAQGLFFKKVGKRRPVFSVRIGRGYRTLGLLGDDQIIWFWIGPHDEYMRLLKSL